MVSVRNHLSQMLSKLLSVKGKVHTKISELQNLYSNIKVRGLA